MFFKSQAILAILLLPKLYGIQLYVYIKEYFLVCYQGKGELIKVLGWMCSLNLVTCTLFQTKICDFPYHISDL